jgi:NADH-quinone oxidoreductase subunit J
MSEFLFLVVALLTALCGIATVVTQNIVRCATWLLFTLVGAATIFFLLGADLVAAVQILVYVGGTLVLVVFGVMLTAQGPFINMKTSSAEWALSALVGLVLLGVLGAGILAVPKMKATDATDGPLLIAPPTLTPRDGKLAEGYKQRQRLIEGLDLREAVAKSPYSAVIGQGFVGVPVGPPHVERPGGQPTVVRAHYLFPFEIVSVHLLVVLIGAAYLARAKRRADRRGLVPPAEAVS